MEEMKKVANEQFDWNAYENDLGVYNQPREEIAEAYDKTLSNVAVGEVVEGTVTGISKREVIVNIGYKSEGIIPISEFRYNPDLKVGDKIEVYVESAEDKNGQLALSHKKARQLKSWDRVNEALEKDEIIKGYIKCRTKGGMIVDVFGIEAFLPGSQIDVKPIRDYDVYVDKTMEFKVVKINQEFRNVVVSHKALIEAELEAQKQVIMSKLEKGQILEGTVKNITSYGVFVDLGGVDGLIHITDLSWGRVNHPEEIVALDQKIQVVILDFDDAKKRIALGLKQLTPHPWEALDQNLKVGDKVSNWNNLAVQLTSVFTLASAPDAEGYEYIAMLITSANRSSRDTFAIGAQNILEIGEAYPLDTPEQIAANTAGYFHALSASTTDFSFTCDGQATEGGAYVQLYDSTTESFTTVSAIPPQGAGYIELVCMVPTTWQQIGVTYTPTFVSGKTLNFTINASDLTKA